MRELAMKMPESCKDMTSAAAASVDSDPPSPLSSLLFPPASFPPCFPGLKASVAPARGSLPRALSPYLSVP